MDTQFDIAILRALAWKFTQEMEGLTGSENSRFIYDL